MTDRIGIRVTCSVCGDRKTPVGRDGGLLWSGCDQFSGCPGYWTDPKPGSLWPGELASDFGYPIGTAGTVEVVTQRDGSEGGA